VSITHLVGDVLLIYMWGVMFPAAILSWFPLEPGHPLAKLRYYLYRATEPVLRPVRRLIPPMGGLDISFIVVFFGVQILVYSVLFR
jgi:YggT family protein